jgi:hypothetical protein
VRSLGGDDYAVSVRRRRSGAVFIEAVSTALPSLGINAVQVTEGDTGTKSAAFAVGLSSASGRSVTVAYTTADGTATAGADYTATVGSLTFPAGTRTQTVTVPVVGDLANAPDETFLVHLSSLVNATMRDAEAVGTILDDAPPGLSIADLDVVEPASGTRTAVFTVTLAPPSASPVAVGYATTALTAAAGSDYDDVSGTLTFAPGVHDAGAESDGPGGRGHRGGRNVPGRPCGRERGPDRLWSGHWPDPRPREPIQRRPVPLPRHEGRRGPVRRARARGGQSRVVALAGRCGIPASARAAALNVTATAASVGGHLSLYPAEEAPPPTSTANYAAEQTWANNAVVSLSPSGALAIRCSQAPAPPTPSWTRPGYFE